MPIARAPEEKAALALLAALDSKSFVPRIFGGAVASGDRGLMSDALNAFQGVIVTLAERWDAQVFDPRERAACHMAAEIRDFYVENYGAFPSYL